MTLQTFARGALFAGGALLATATAFAQDAPKKPHVPLEKTIGQVTPTGPVPSLAVINADGATLADGKLTLTGVSPNSIVFADRPVRAAGHVMTAQFIMQWDEDKHNFAIDPPNATVSVLGGDGSDVSDAVVTLTAPKLEGGTLTFDVTVLEGSLGGSGPAAVFIDHFSGSFHGGDGGYGHVGGNAYGGYHATYAHDGNVYHTGDVDHYGGTYWHAPAYHGAWYGAGAVAAGAVAGAAVGAAAADAYANPPYCGYYPYPPCY